jgi:hypothetical protein
MRAVVNAGLDDVSYAVAAGTAADAPPVARIPSRTITASDEIVRRRPRRRAWEDREHEVAEAEYRALAQRRFADTAAEPLARSTATMAALCEAPNPALRYQSVYEILLREGLAFKVKARPRDMRAGIAGRCYANCHAIAARRGTRYAYCEGIAFADFGMPVEHAWLLDLTDGRAVDPTWDEEPTQTYLGVVVETNYLEAAFARSGRVLDECCGRQPVLTGEAGHTWRHAWHGRHNAAAVDG